MTRSQQLAIKVVAEHQFCSIDRKKIIHFNIFRLILKQTELTLVNNQSENVRNNLILAGFQQDIEVDFYIRVC